MASAVVGLVVLLFAIRAGECWPNGAPFKTCINRFPKHHGSEQQTSSAPYQIIVNQTTYRPSEVLQVTLRSSSGKKFRGFQIGAQLSSSSGPTDMIVGEWVSHDNKTTRLQYWYPEKPETHNCATHLNNDDKDEIVLHWKAPSEDVSDIVFKSGFVQDFETFWSNVESSIVRSEIGVTKSPEVSPSPPTKAGLSTGDCGTSKGCFLCPRHCSDDDCQFGVTYKDVGGEKVQFEMFGGAEKYVSLALSADDKMGNDETVTCISTGSQNSIQHGYNPAYNNDHHRNFNLSDKIVTRIDGRIYCSFVRPYRIWLTHVNDNHAGGYKNITKEVKSFDLSEKFFIQLAWGDLYQGSTVIKKHTEQPVLSLSKVDLLKKDVGFCVGIPAYLKAHAILGYSSWFFLTGCAMIVARHYRQVLDVKFAGTALWFQVHRGSMFFAAIATAVLIIVIFSSVGKWSKRATNHAILGLITMGLAIVQIVFGMLRPGLDSNRRPLFNYFHRSVGTVAQILAVTTLLLGVQIEVLPRELRYILTVTIAVSVAVFLIFEIILECIRVFEAYRVTQTLPADDKQLQIEPDVKQSTRSRMDIVKRVLLFLLALTANASLVVFSTYLFMA